MPQVEWDVDGTAGWQVLNTMNDLVPTFDHDCLAGSRTPLSTYSQCHSALVTQFHLKKKWGQ